MGLALGEKTPGPLIIAMTFGFAGGWTKAIFGLDALFLFSVNAMAGRLPSIRIGHPKRPHEQTRNDQAQKKCKQYPILRMPQTLTPCEIYPGTLASPTDVFPIPILMAIAAINGRSTGGTNTRHIRKARKIRNY